MENAKYEYLLKYWGGFFNKHNLKYHNEIPKSGKGVWFNTKKERDEEKQRLVDLSNNIRKINNDAILVFDEEEGYLVRKHVTIESLMLWENKIHIVQNKLGYGFLESEHLDYLIEWKYDIYGEDIEGNQIPDDAILLHTYLKIK